MPSQNVNIFKRHTTPIKIIAFKHLTDNLGIPLKGLVAEFRINYVQQPVLVLSKESGKAHALVLLRPRGTAIFSNILIKAPTNPPGSYESIVDFTGVDCKLNINDITIGPFQVNCKDGVDADDDVKLTLKNIRIISYGGGVGAGDVTNNEGRMYLIHRLGVIFTNLEVEVPE
jgi:hypothetical protein